MKQYVNWHAHSVGSILDGNSKALEYATRAKELGMPAFTFTDHGNLHTVLDANEAAKEAGIVFLPGQEFYQARKTRFDKDEDERAGRARHEWDQRGPHHLGLIAYNNVGYHNLLKLSSEAFMTGFHVKPRIDFELLDKHSEGLVCLSGCLSGMLSQAILRDDRVHAIQTATSMQDIFGKENYFIEIMDHGIPEELATHDGLKAIAKHIDAPIICSCDSHYTHKGQACSHDISLCVATGAKKDDENRFRFSGDHFYLKSYEEMNKLFPEEYLDNSMLIYEKHDLNIQYGDYHFPKFPIPDNHTEWSFFEYSVREGAANRFGENWESNAQLTERIEYELNAVKQLGFSNYFLIVADIVETAREIGCLNGAARGSAAGCMLAYCLSITEVDPIKYDLAFERFLVYVSPKYDFNFPKVST